MRTAFLSIALFFSGFMIVAQVAPSKYFIEFTDKTGTPYSVDNPELFLSQRSLDRRSLQNIQIIEEDLPVNPSYVSQVAGLGVTVLNRSKWFNGIVIQTDDTTKLATISSFPFVRKILKNYSAAYGADYRYDKFVFENQSISGSFLSGIKSGASAASFDYGPSLRQIQMMNGDQLHSQGYRGEGKVIAVLDGGFLQVDVLNAFDSLRENGQILGTRDFVNPGGNVYQEDIHGMCVLSLMGGNLPGMIIGTAPKASFWLLRTEDGSSEYIIEEYNWVCAAEFADSAGADIITSSLGYTTFHDPSTNHTCEEMNGNSAPSTRGANIAFQKGMVVVSSAGNEGTNASWQCISAPADGDHVLGIGAVDSSGVYAAFSSKGIVDGSRVKPNVSAMGRRTWIYWNNETIVQGSGTSFSCPLVTGLVACLWQAKPDVTPARLFSSIQESGSRYSSPDSLTGYGIPDFSKALQILSVPAIPPAGQSIFPNPFSDRLTIPLSQQGISVVTIGIYDIMGRIVFRNDKEIVSPDQNTITVSGLGALKPGFYVVRVQGGSATGTFGAVKK